MPIPELYRLDIDGEWTLRDFHEFPYAYTQAYSFLYSLNIREVQDEERVWEVFNSYPWRGGYSAVNFYNQLYRIVPLDERPAIVSISYSSPGWIELSLALAVALSLRRIIHQLVESGRDIHRLYTEIHDEMHKRKLLRIEAKTAELNLEREHLRFIEEATDVFTHALGLENVEQLHKYSPNRLRTLKILLSFFRRIRKLEEYEEQKRLKF